MGAVTKVLPYVGGVALLIIIGSSAVNAQITCQQYISGARVALCVVTFNLQRIRLEQKATNTTFCSLASTMLCCIRSEIRRCPNQQTYLLKEYDRLALAPVTTVDRTRIDSICPNKGQYVLTGEHTLCGSGVSLGFQLIVQLVCVLATYMVGM